MLYQWIFPTRKFPHKECLWVCVCVTVSVNVTVMLPVYRCVTVLVNVTVMLPVYRCVTVSVNVTVMLASVLLIVHSLEPEAVTIATQPPSIRRVSTAWG